MGAHPRIRVRWTARLRYCPCNPTEPRTRRDARRHIALQHLVGCCCTGELGCAAPLASQAEEKNLRSKKTEFDKPSTDQTHQAEERARIFMPRSLSPACRLVPFRDDQAPPGRLVHRPGLQVLDPHPLPTKPNTPANPRSRCPGLSFSNARRALSVPFSVHFPATRIHIASHAFPSISPTACFL
ncbi:hypothetical protein VTK26DRAFT_4650 [Humicola hyalothermophila]